MTALSRRASLLVARASLVVVVLSFAAFGTWTAGGLFGQPTAQKKQRVEEEEEAPKAKKPKRKVIPVEDEEPPNPKTKAKSGSSRPAGPAPSGDLTQLAEQAGHPALKALFSSLAVPHDVVSYKPSSVTISGERRQEEKIVPTPFYLGNDPGRYKERLRFTPLTKDWKRGQPYDPLIENLQSVRPYEEIAQDKVRRFLRENHEELSRYDMLVAAEQVLSSVLRWHESAIQTGKRTGKEWENVGKTLRKQLLDHVLLEQMRVLAEAKNWDRVLELTHRLAVTYGKDADYERIFQPVADMMKSALNPNDPTGTDEKRQKARERLHELEMEFPDQKAFRPLSEMLRQQAQDLLDKAKTQAEAKNNAGAHGFLLQAKKTWPQLPGLREFEADLNNDHPILRVGVRGPLPKYFSPAWACTDTEHCAVEMLFESLVKLVPDGRSGFRYGRGLAASSPKVAPLGRLFQLPPGAVWSDRRQPLTSADVKFSLELLQAGTGVGRSRVWGDLLADIELRKDPFQLTLRLKQGFLDPLAPMTFKILPLDKPVDSVEFAQNPVTSGPYLLGPQKSDEGQRECRFFLANPAYSNRPAKRDAPHIQEIRFYSYNSNDNLAEQLGSGKLDLVLDLTAKEAEGLLKNPNTNITVPMPSRTVPNRRIYFLAINTRNLDSVDLRQALSCAINREALLNKHFRTAGKAPLHKALNGPFPAGSWACKAGPALYNRDNAILLKNHPAVINAVKSGPWVLKYAADNPALDEAMKELCAQVKELTEVVLEPRPCDPYQLRADVEQTKNYDLAYYHYDFPDEIYWLAPLFGPPPGREDETNIFKYHNGDLTKLLDGTKSFRDFAKVKEHQRLIHAFLNREMPFIPLWQLDPLLAYRNEVRPASLDPLLLFGNIEEWRLQRK